MSDVISGEPAPLGYIVMPIGSTMDEIKREVVVRTLAAANFDKVAAARKLDVSIKTIYNILKRNGLPLRPPAFEPWGGQ